MRTRRRGPRASERPLLNTLLVSWWLPETIRRVKFGSFAEGSVPAWLLTLSEVPLLGRALRGGAAAVTQRRFFVNRYGPATPGRPRLSFTYYELVDFEKFPQAVAALLALAADFRARTGWAPGALAVYFVRRPGDKATSNYSGPRGVSCTLDPVTVRRRERERVFFFLCSSFLSLFLQRLSLSFSLSPHVLLTRNFFFLSLLKPLLLLHPRAPPATRASASSSRRATP